MWKSLWTGLLSEIKESAKDSKWNGFYCVVLLLAYLGAPAFLDEESMPFAMSAILTGSACWLALRISLTKSLADMSPQIASSRKWRISALPMIAIIAASTAGIGGLMGNTLDEILRLVTGIFVFGGYLLFGDVRDWCQQSRSTVEAIEAGVESKEQASMLLEKAKARTAESETPPSPRNRRGL